MSDVRRLKVTDTVLFDPPQISMKQKDKLMRLVDKAHKQRGSLLTEVEVSHAGIVNRNKGYYKPEKMRSAAHTWVTPTAKPVLLNHDTGGGGCLGLLGADRVTPIGRVVAAKYVDTIPMEDPPQDAKKAFSNDYSYKGLGHIKVVANITDPEYITQVLDGTLAMVSIGGETNAAVCSICGQDWADKGKCEHKLGESYVIDEDTRDIRTAFLEFGDMIYDELSFVNVPADPYAYVTRRQVSQDDPVGQEILNTYTYKASEIFKVSDNFSGNSDGKPLYTLVDFLAVDLSESDGVRIESLTGKQAPGNMYDLLRRCSARDGGCKTLIAVRDMLSPDSKESNQMVKQAKATDLQDTGTQPPVDSPVKQDSPAPSDAATPAQDVDSTKTPDGQGSQAVPQDKTVETTDPVVPPTPADKAQVLQKPEDGVDPTPTDGADGDGKTDAQMADGQGGCPDCPPKEPKPADAVVDPQKGISELLEDAIVEKSNLKVQIQQLSEQITKLEVENSRLVEQDTNLRVQLHRIKAERVLERLVLLRKLRADEVTDKGAWDAEVDKLCKNSDEHLQGQFDLLDEEVRKTCNRLPSVDSPASYDGKDDQGGQKQDAISDEQVVKELFRGGPGARPRIVQ